MKVTSKIRTAGSALALHRWNSKSEAERKQLLKKVRDAKKHQSSVQIVSPHK